MLLFRFLLCFSLSLLLFTPILNEFADARLPDDPCSFTKKHSYIKLSYNEQTRQHMCEKVDYWVPERCGKIAGLYKTDSACQPPKPVPPVPHTESSQSSSKPVPPASQSPSTTFVQQPSSYSNNPSGDTQNSKDNFMIPIVLIAVVAIVGIGVLFKKLQSKKQPPIHPPQNKYYSSMKVGEYFFDDVMNAKNSIHICSPWISVSYAEKFIKLAKSGVSVNIITSEQKKNTKTVEILHNFKDQRNFHFALTQKSHSKFFIIDYKIAIDGSANFTHTGLWNQDNNITIYHDSQDITRFLEIFTRLLKTEKTPPSDISPPSNTSTHKKCTNLRCNRYVKVGNSKCNSCGKLQRLQTPIRKENTEEIRSTSFEYSLFHMTDIENIHNILKHGILSHDMSIGKRPKRRSDRGIVDYRKTKRLSSGKTLTHYANFYFNVTNPMLYRILKEDYINKENIIIIEIIKDINQDGIFVSDGNCAKTNTDIKPVSDAKEIFQSIHTMMNKSSWNNDEELKRQFMAECLIPEKVESKMIYTIHVQNETIKNKIKKILEDNFPKLIHVKIKVNPKMFFSY